MRLIDIAPNRLRLIVEARRTAAATAKAGAANAATTAAVAAAMGNSWAELPYLRTFYLYAPCVLVARIRAGDRHLHELPKSRSWRLRATHFAGGRDDKSPQASCLLSPVKKKPSHVGSMLHGAAGIFKQPLKIHESSSQHTRHENGQFRDPKSSISG